MLVVLSILKIYPIQKCQKIISSKNPKFLSQPSYQRKQVLILRGFGTMISHKSEKLIFKFYVRSKHNWIYMVKPGNKSLDGYGFLKHCFKKSHKISTINYIFNR